jgi:hypothetical protein
MLRGEGGYVGTPMLPTTASLRCSSLGGILYRSSLRHRRPSPPGVILVASHLRIRDGQLRLRIIEHNLRMLSSSSSSTPLSSSSSSGVVDSSLPRRECVLIFSIDDKDGDAICSMVDDWRNSTIASSAALSGMISGVMYVPNDPVLVDASVTMNHQAVLELFDKYCEL